MNACWHAIENLQAAMMVGTSLKYLSISYRSIKIINIYNANVHLYIILACPCHTDCLDGCTDCENLICSCKDDTNGKNLDACAAEITGILGNCTLGCKSETDCQLSCLETFERNYSNCPCQKNCPLGCPCPEYECKIEKEMAILVLSTQQSTNKPVLLLSNGNIVNLILIGRIKSILWIIDCEYLQQCRPIRLGGVDDNLDFRLGEGTEVYHSCSAILNDQMYVFGGSIETKQVRILAFFELLK